jgi:hypothetical protein
VSQRISRFQRIGVVVAFLTLAAGAVAFGQQNTRTEVMYWHAGSPLRLRVTWIEGSFSTDLNGQEILASQPGENGQVDEWAKLDPLFKVGGNTLTFSGAGGADSHSWRFDVVLESMATGRWAPLKDYTAKGPDAPGSSPHSVQYKVTVTITVSE